MKNVGALQRGSEFSARRKLLEFRKCPGNERIVAAIKVQFMAQGIWAQSKSKKLRRLRQDSQSQLKFVHGKLRD